MTNNAKMFIKENIDLIQLEHWDELLLKLVGDFGDTYDGDTIIADVLHTLHDAGITIEDKYEFYPEYTIRNFSYKDDNELTQDLVNATYQKIDLEDVYKTSMWKLARCLSANSNKYCFYVQYTEDIVGYPQRICCYIMKGTGRNHFAYCIQIDDGYGGTIKLYKLANKSCIHFFNNVGFVVDYSHYDKEIRNGVNELLSAIHAGDVL